MKLRPPSRSQAGQALTEFLVSFPLVLASFLVVTCIFVMWMGSFFIRHQLHEWLVCKASLAGEGPRCLQRKLAWFMSTGSSQVAIPGYCPDEIASWFLTPPRFSESPGTFAAKATLTIKIKDLIPKFKDGIFARPCATYKIPFSMALSRKAVQR